MGHLLTFAAGQAMSAPATEADVGEPIYHVRYGPEAELVSAAPILHAAP